MKCPHCNTTRTIRAGSVSDGVHHSGRLISLGVVLYMFGLSCRKTAGLLPLLGCRVSKSSIEKDICYAGQRTKELHFVRQDPMPQQIPENIEKLVRRYSDCCNDISSRINQLM